MIHRCKVQCHTMSAKELETLGLDDSEPKWMPFIFDMATIDAAKLSSDEEDSPSFNCTTIFTKAGDTFIISTPYMEFFNKLEKYNNDLYFFMDEEEGGEEERSDDDLDL